MPFWLECFLYLLAAVVVALIISSIYEYRLKRRYKDWLCPVCGRPFGIQKEWPGWMVFKARKDLPNEGIALTCYTCEKEFYFDYEGHRVSQATATDEEKSR
ncbi:MAG: hypothetical protein L6R28_22970 [Planctomycetes bacterium]|nr:hypothetical protein [Planctomycetota bacterium]